MFFSGYLFELQPGIFATMSKIFCDDGYFLEIRVMIIFIYWVLGFLWAAAPNKEWKPKSAIQAPDVPGSFETNSEPGVPEEATSKLQLKLEGLHLSDGEHVIIPNHLQVPEAERTGLSFGSFDASFSLGTSFANGPCNGKYSMLLTNTSPIHEESIKASRLR